jgi:hypothetical protein
VQGHGKNDARLVKSRCVHRVSSACRSASGAQQHRAWFLPARSFLYSIMGRLMSWRKVSVRRMRVPIAAPSVPIQTGLRW